jgi:RNA recognition motif-containing protein
MGLMVYKLHIDSTTYALFDTSTTSFNTIVTDTFTYSDQKRLHLKAFCNWATIPIAPPFGFQTSWGGINIQILDASNNSIVYSTSMAPGEKLENGLLGLYEFYIPYGSYKLKVTGTPHMRAKVKVEQHWKEFDSTSLDIGGVRVHSIADYANIGDETNRREFVYGAASDSDWASFSGLGIGYNINEEYNEVGLTRLIAVAHDGFSSQSEQYCAYNTIRSSNLNATYNVDAGTITYPKVIEINYASNGKNNGGTEYEFYSEEKRLPFALATFWPTRIWDALPIVIPGGAPMNNDFRAGLTKNVKVFTFTEKFGTRNFIQETKNYYAVDSSLLVTDSFYIVKEAIKRNYFGLVGNIFMIMTSTNTISITVL